MMLFLHATSPHASIVTPMATSQVNPTPSTAPPSTDPMLLTLAEGCYARTASIALVKSQVDAAVRFLESQGAPDDMEEDIASREQRIARLQAQWAQLRAQMGSANASQNIRIAIQIETP